MIMWHNILITNCDIQLEIQLAQICSSYTGSSCEWMNETSVLFSPFLRKLKSVYEKRRKKNNSRNDARNKKRITYEEQRRKIERYRKGKQ